MKTILAIFLSLTGLALGQGTTGFGGGGAVTIAGMPVQSYRLGASTLANAVTFTLDRVPIDLAANRGMLVIDPFTTEAELRLISSITGAVVTPGANLTYAHAAGDSVFFVPFGLVDVTLWGAKGTDNTADAGTNVTAFNRLSQQIYTIGVVNGPSGIFIPNGKYYISNELEPERDQFIVGASLDATQIKATDDFPFTDTGEVAMIHPMRDGVSVLYATPGASGRWPMRDLFVIGRDVANSNGILSSPQQPDRWENIRVEGCAGLYGICIADCQQHQMTNLVLTGNNIALRYRSASFVWTRTLNIEQSITGDFISEIQAGGASCNQNSFDGVHLESPLTAGEKYFNIGAGVCWSFKNVWVTNQDTTATLFYFNQGAESISDYPVFTLENIIAGQNSTDFKMVHDVGRSLSINSQEQSRIIPLIVSGTAITWALNVDDGGHQ